MQLEFGRGFTYNRPLRVNLLDLDFELAEQLVSNLAQAVLSCNAGRKPTAGSPAGLNCGSITPSWLSSSPLPTSRQLFLQMPQQIKLRADHGAAWSHTAPGEALLQQRLQRMGLGQMGWHKMSSKAAMPKSPPSAYIYAVAFFNITGNALSCLSVLNLLQKHCFLGFFPQADTLPVFQTCF